MTELLRTAALFALTAFAVYSSHDVVVKFLGGSYSPVQIVFFANLFGFPIVTLMLMRDRVDGNLRPRHPWWTLIRTVAAVASTTCVFYAFSVLPMAQTYALIFAAPLIITILAIPILGETVGLRRTVAVAVGLRGIGSRDAVVAGVEDAVGVAVRSCHRQDVGRPAVFAGRVAEGGARHDQLAIDRQRVPEEVARDHVARGEREGLHPLGAGVGEDADRGAGLVGRKAS